MKSKKQPTLRIRPKSTKPKSSGKKSSRKKSGKKKKWLPAVLTIVLLAIIAGIAYFLATGNEGHRGIDVSHHQGNIDWQKVGEEKDLEFVLVKATEGLKMNDPLFTQNLHGARNAQLKVGAYHFFLPNDDGLSQFNHFVKVVGHDIDLKPILDLENAPKRTINDEDYNKQVKKYIDACVKYYGCQPIIYASPSFLKDHKLTETIKNCPYWAAWYPPLPNFMASKRRFLMTRFPGTQAIMWQYADDGSHAGIKGHVDLDECWEMATIEL